ncbi:MAG TPA: M20/M25/M40 family metallo-hydrolase [Blastocatellia bacterium]|nr:M20/M25/M40 family metallo-hydrolase [Blastocatellia bacterium]
MIPAPNKEGERRPRPEPDADAAVAAALDAPAVRRAFAAIDVDGERITRELIEICEIEAPPFSEGERAAWFAAAMQAAGLTDVRRDGAGNAVGVHTGRRRDSYVVLSAHLDTIFPAGTDCRVRFEDGRLAAPGIADDSVGLAAMLAVARAITASGLGTNSSILFLATVGEEGEGDLRGVRHFFSDPEMAAAVRAFLSLDGPGVERITHRALGSRRFAVTFTGPGGHSWGDFGIVNPIHALGRAVAALAAYPTPLEPRTTFNVGHVSGGASVNTIAESAAMRIDLRSTSDDELDRIEEFFRACVTDSVSEENRVAAPSGTRLDVTIEQIGSRPSGETAVESPLVQTVLAASRAFGIRTTLDCSSTDSNVPISLGIPALTLGCGGTSANIHSLAEWYDPANREVGLKRTVLVLAALAGVVDGSPVA